MSASYLTGSVFNKYGRFSAYGSPTDVKVLSDVTKGNARYLEIIFTVLSASGADSPRKGIIAAIQSLTAAESDLSNLEFFEASPRKETL